MPRSTGIRRGVAGVRWAGAGWGTTVTTPSTGSSRTPMEQYLMVTVVEEEEAVLTNLPRGGIVGCRRTCPVVSQ